MSNQQNPDQVQQETANNEENQGMIYPHFFHSHPDSKKTFRRYSAAGYTTMNGEQPVLVIAFAVCGENEKEFNKKKAHLITVGRLRVGKFQVVPITQEQYEHPARTLQAFASNNAPLTAFPKDLQARRFEEVITQLKQRGDVPEELLPIHPAQIMVALPTDEQLEKMEKAFIEQQESGINLGSLLQLVNKTPQAEA